MKTLLQFSPKMKSSLMFLLLFTAMANAQIIDIPDAGFKNVLCHSACLDNNNDGVFGGDVDTNNDNEIQLSEALAVINMRIYLYDVYDLTGIQAFANLERLYCADNQLTSLDLGGLNNLKQVACANNQLTYLNIANLPNLEMVTAMGNQLSSIDLTGLTSLVLLGIEANQFTTLELPNLPNLWDLRCEVNQLTTLDVRNLTALKSLKASANQLTSVQVSGLQDLWILHLTQNQLTEINLDDLPSLGELQIGYNQLTALDATSCPMIETLTCSFNPLTSLNVSGLANLRGLFCFDNQLTSLDLNGVTSLSNFDCHNNQITSLDLNSALQLYSIDCANNQLVTLLMKNGARENEINISNNPNLVYICQDEQWVTYLLDEALANSAATVVGSYCTFRPGGNYNIITGNIKYDLNGNGCDASDLVMPNMRVNISTGSSGAAFTNNAGYYAFFTQAGSYDVAPAVENPTWFGFTPESATVAFANNSNNIENRDFCISGVGVRHDVEVVVSPVVPARPGFEAKYQITIRNKGNQSFSEGNVSLQFEGNLMSFVSASQVPVSQAQGELHWTYTNLLPFESKKIWVTFVVNAPTATPAVNVGDVLHFTATALPVDTDENPADNSFSYQQTVVGSYDPNNIICIEGAVVPPTAIGDYLHYAVNFENSGTFEAENIVVRLEIDPAKYDIGSLQLMNSSYDVDARITDNRVEFIFEHINLEIGGHGHILLKIRSNDDLVTGDSVSNRADIFFDYNFPVDTGMVSTVFQTLSKAVFEWDDTVSVYPNPASEQVTVKAGHNIQSVQLFDVQGRLVSATLTNGLETKIDISDCSKGVYVLKITTAKGASVQKLIKK